MFMIQADTRPNTDYQTEYISTIGMSADWFKPSRTPCNISTYNYCFFRLPCGRCRKTGQMCPVSNGYYTTWC